MCVRLCDGYYFPISFKTATGNLGADQQRCNESCYNAPTKLFYYANPGGSIETMRSLDGGLYTDLANAFKYRKKFVADCRCKAEPWTAMAKQQHESWALSAKYRSEEKAQSAEMHQVLKMDTPSDVSARQGVISQQY